MSRHKNVSARRRVKLIARKRGEPRFAQALDSLLAGFRPDAASDVAVETQLANFKAERPALFESRHVRDRKLAAALAKPRPEPDPRPRVTRRAAARAAAKEAAR